VSSVQLVHRSPSKPHRHNRPNQTRECPGLHPSSPRHHKGIRRTRECLLSIGWYPELSRTQAHIRTELLSFLHRCQTALEEVYLETCLEAIPFDSYSHQPTRSKTFLREEKVIVVWSDPYSTSPPKHYDLPDNLGEDSKCSRMPKREPRVHVMHPFYLIPTKHRVTC
jgi:hypothetical protein